MAGKKTWEKAGLAKVDLSPRNASSTPIRSKCGINAAVFGRYFQEDKLESFIKHTEWRKTGSRVLYASKVAGAVDLIHGSSNPDILVCNDVGISSATLIVSRVVSRF